MVIKFNEFVIYGLIKSFKYASTGFQSMVLIILKLTITYEKEGGKKYHKTKTIKEKSDWKTF